MIMESLLFLNFTDELKETIYKDRINLVSTTNNHLLNKKIDGSMRTHYILDKYNTFHIDSYRNLSGKK